MEERMSLFLSHPISVGMIIILVSMAGCAPREYGLKPQANADLQDAVPLYTAPPPVSVTPLTSGSMGVVQSNTLAPLSQPVANPPATQNPYPLMNVPASSPETTGSISGSIATPTASPVPMQNFTSPPPFTVYKPAPQVAYQTSNNVMQKQNTRPYTVEAGDTIYAIGRKFNINPSQIVSNNNLPNNNVLTMGQIIYLPVGDVRPFPQESYNIQSPKTATQVASLSPQEQKSIPQNNTVMNDAGTSRTALLQAVRESRSSGSVQQTKTEHSKPSIPSPAPVVSSTKTYLKIPTGGRIVQDYKAPNSTGLKISVPDGAPIHVAAMGEVIYVGTVDGYGKMVLIRHDNGFVSNYARLKNVAVKQGQTVDKGDLIATGGKSEGYANSEMLFELRQGTKTIDPTKYIG